MNIRGVIDQAISLAQVVGEVFPPIAGGAAVIKSAENLLDSLKDHAPDGQSAEQLEAAHQALLKRAQDAGHALSDELRG